MQRARPRPRRKAQDSRRAGLSCGRFGKLQRRQAFFAKSQPRHCITSKRRIRNSSATPPRLRARSRCAARRPFGIVSDPPVRFPLIRSIGSIAFAWAPRLCPHALQPARLRRFMLAPPLEWGGGGRPPRPGTAPTQAGTAAAPKRKAGRLDVVHSPARLESIFRQSLSPERATALLPPHGGPSNPISPAPTTDFAPSRPTRAGRAPAREQASNPKNMSRKKEIKPKTPGPSSLRLGFRTPSRIPPPRPPERSLLDREKKGREKKQASSADLKKHREITTQRLPPLSCCAGLKKSNSDLQRPLDRFSFDYQHRRKTIPQKRASTLPPTFSRWKRPDARRARLAA